MPEKALVFGARQLTIALRNGKFRSICSPSLTEVYYGQIKVSSSSTDNTRT